MPVWLVILLVVGCLAAGLLVIDLLTGGPSVRWFQRKPRR